MIASQLIPILKALRRHIGAVLLIVLQVTLTVGVVTNCAFVISDAVRISETPTGVDEENIGMIQSIRVIGTDGSGSVSRNLVALRQLPHVVSAAFGMPPFTGVGETQVRTDLSLPPVTVRYFEGSQGYPATLGLNIVAGTAINELDIPSVGDKAEELPALISKPLKERLFGEGSAVGKIINGQDQRYRIVGVAQALRSSIGESPTEELALLSMRFYGDKDFGGLYIIRAQPGHLTDALQTAEDTLRKLNPNHVQSFVSTLDDLRARRTAKKTGLAKTLSIIVAVLVATTCFSIGALTTLWVRQRRRQMGIRRALGATARHVLAYFLLENMFIVGLGGITGVALAITINRWAMHYVELPSLTVKYCVASLTASVAAGLLFALGPAWRASKVPPISVIRDV